MCEEDKKEVQKEAQPQQPEEDNQYRQELSQYRNTLVEQGLISGREISNVITIIATGALVISIGLFDKFYTVTDLYLVGLSWIFFLITLLFLIIGNWFSAKAFEKQIELFDAGKLKTEKNEEKNEEENEWKTRVDGANIVIRSSLFVGIVLLAVYAFGSLRITPQEQEETVNCICSEQNKGEENEHNKDPSSKAKASPITTR